MPKKKKSRKPRAAKRGGSKRPSHAEDPSLRLAAESRTALSVTVAWMLSLMATLAAEVLGVVCKAYLRFVGGSEVLTVLSAVMLLVALASGSATLLLTPVALRIVQTRPPRIVVQVAYVAGVLPWLAVVLRYLIAA